MGRLLLITSIPICHFTGSYVAKMDWHIHLQTAVYQLPCFPLLRAMFAKQTFVALNRSENDSLSYTPIQFVFPVFSLSVLPELISPSHIPTGMLVLPAVCCSFLSSSGFSLLDDWVQRWFPQLRCLSSMGSPWYSGSKTPLLSLLCAPMLGRVGSHRRCDLQECHRLGQITCYSLLESKTPAVHYTGMNVNLCDCLAVPQYVGISHRAVLCFFIDLSLVLSEAFFKI